MSGTLRKAVVAICGHESVLWQRSGDRLPPAPFRLTLPAMSRTLNWVRVTSSTANSIDVTNADFLRTPLLSFGLGLCEREYDIHFPDPQGVDRRESFESWLGGGKEQVDAP